MEAITRFIWFFFAVILTWFRATFLEPFHANFLVPFQERFSAPFRAFFATFFALFRAFFATFFVLFRERVFCAVPFSAFHDTFHAYHQGCTLCDGDEDIFNNREIACPTADEYAQAK